jgi:hypothetical protein
VLKASLLALLIVATGADPTGTGGGTVDSWTGTIEQGAAVVEGSASGSAAGGGTHGGSSSGGAPEREIDTTCEGPCIDGRDAPDMPPGDAVTVVTLSDIARFRPTPGIQRMEPNGWVIVGLPANIYSIVDTQIVPGELLGQSADVRFTPISWQWNYGDGESAALTTKGGTWTALRLHEFDTTPTSHTYQQAGNYTIRLNITYRAEYRIAGAPFTPITGTLTLPANELHITASGAKTVLVDRDCTAAPRGPGC